MAREKNPKPEPRAKPLHPIECKKRTDHKFVRTVAREELTIIDYPFMLYEWVVCPSCGLQRIKVKIITEGGPRSIIIEHAVVSTDILEDISRHVDWMSGNRLEEDDRAGEQHP